MKTSSEKPAGRFDGIRPLVIDHVERPSRQDFGYGETIFTRQFAFLPRRLRRRR
jgi:hypothetical protein